MTVLPDENEAEMREKAPDDEDEEESDDDGDNEDEVITEIRFVPSDKAACECVCTSIDALLWIEDVPCTAPHFMKLHTVNQTVWLWCSNPSQNLSILH